MPIIITRKVTTVGESRGITLPKSWLEYYRQKFGVEIKKVVIEVNDVLKVSPIIPKEKSPQNGDLSVKLRT